MVINAGKFLRIFVALFVSFCALQLTEGKECSGQYPHWSVGNGRVYVNNKVFRIKGAAWYGFGLNDHAPSGLWMRSLSSLISLLRHDIGVNVVRLPFAVDIVLKDYKDTRINCTINPDICKLSSMDLMEYIIDELGNNGILVVLDQQVMRCQSPISKLWYELPDYPESLVLKSWDMLLDRLASKWNLLAIDLKNEPHDTATWGRGNIETDWNSYVERAIWHICSKYPQYKGLFFVEGIGDNKFEAPHHLWHFWGDNLEGVRRHPISTGFPSMDRRVVYTPHTYGPSNSNMSYFMTPDFPRNMPFIWDLQWAFVRKEMGLTVVTGEWGGFYYPGTMDRTWADAFASYLIESDIRDNMYWAFNAYGGLLLDDWKTLRKDKVALLNRVQPNPSRLTKENGKYCYEPGSF